MKRLLYLLALTSLLAACSDDNTGSLAKTYTKAEAADLDGVTTDGRDICGLMGWYDDGVCDTFCVEQDQNCTPDNSCGADTGRTCADTEYCAFPPSDACGVTTEGVCKVKPVACDQNYDPVCGCDGITYSNACTAIAAGINAAAPGECPTTCTTRDECAEDEVCVDQICVPACTANTDCTNDLVCDDGLCVPACTANTDCTDGELCIEGLCGPLPTTCDAENACPLDYFCFYDETNTCGANPQPGSCQEVPVTCTRDLMPVCGCDNQTYTNACEAAKASVNVQASGECPIACSDATQCPEGDTCVDNLCVTPVACGGRLGDTCQPTEYCHYDLTDGCGLADQPGVCTPLPTVCEKNYLPVCGCDNQTYGNACTANAAGVSVSYDGACRPTCLVDLDCGRGGTCENGFCLADTACGARAGDTCDPLTEWCNFNGTVGQCGIFDVPGVCAPKPDACPDVVDPVCGCDNQTYNNACAAYAAGVDIVAEGACLPVR